MGKPAVAPPVPEEPPENSFADRALGVFFSPVQAFESIARQPDFLAPLIVMTVASIVVVEAMLEKIGAGRIVQRSLEMSGKGAQMTPEQMAEAVNRAATITAVFMRVVGVVAVPLFLLLLAAVGLFIVNVVFGATADFKTCLSVVCYANLVLIVSAVLGLVMIFFGDPQQFNPQNLTPTTVGFFLNPQTASKPLYIIASSFDVFRVWFLALVSLGLSTATGKTVGTAAIFLTYFGIWIVLVLGRAGLAALVG